MYDICMIGSEHVKIVAFTMSRLKIGMAVNNINLSVIIHECM
jgi:hypothetical protein